MCGLHEDCIAEGGGGTGGAAAVEGPRGADLVLLFRGGLRLCQPPAGAFHCRQPVHDTVALPWTGNPVLPGIAEVQCMVRDISGGVTAQVKRRTHTGL